MQIRIFQREEHIGRLWGGKGIRTLEELQGSECSQQRLVRDHAGQVARVSHAELEARDWHHELAFLTDPHRELIHEIN